MARIRAKNTRPELLMFRMLRKEGVYFARHGEGLPGRPDITFRRCRLAVFIDGDFWHGRCLHDWEGKLSIFWRRKIAGNRRRDRRTDRALHRLGWGVLHLWTEDVESDPERSLRRILRAREARLRVFYRNSDSLGDDGRCRSRAPRDKRVTTSA